MPCSWHRWSPRALCSFTANRNLGVAPVGHSTDPNSISKHGLSNGLSVFGQQRQCPFENCCRIDLTDSDLSSDGIAMAEAFKQNLLLKRRNQQIILH